MGQSNMAVPGNMPAGAMGATGTGVMGGNVAASMPATPVAAPSTQLLSAANGPVSSGVQRPALSANGNVANTPAVSRTSATAVSGPAAPTNSAPALAQTAASALAVSTNVPPTTPTPAALATNTPVVPVSTPYTPITNTDTVIPERASPAPIRGGRGQTLSDEDKLILLQICLECQNTLRFTTKTAFWRRVCNRFENVRHRQYSAGSCEKTIAKLTNARRAALKRAGPNGKKVMSDAERMSLLVDRMIELQDEIEEQTREKETRLKEIYTRLEGEAAARTTKMMEAMNDYYQSMVRGETQVSPSGGSNHTPQGSNSNAASPVDLTNTDNNTTNNTSNNNENHDNDNDNRFDFDTVVLSEISKIRQILSKEVSLSVASSGFQKESTASMSTRLDRLEEQFTEMKKTLDQQTGILSDQNTVLRQLLTMMNNGRRVSQGSWPQVRGPTPQGFVPQGFPGSYPPGYPQGAPQGPLPQGVLPQGVPQGVPQGIPQGIPQGVPPQGFPSQGHPPQRVPPQANSQGPPPQENPQGPSPHSKAHSSQPPQVQGGTFGVYRLQASGPPAGSSQASNSQASGPNKT
ncbi:hypothetical protein TSTA_059050 [Talaromyces stipitatus ATCC 10500]|uniref:Uncharacterized protein n=1 Tax=Talaromyces stipitatus (strain ATCC 10500 / CBS 375.48 / QM 6759 / NRRL 1006) TaxID=441959 RepID=B8MRY1_TALSN|nr:uncharacterized protein TSTA_059050 [Talaromyces stipitatus ATCC 10500]EED13417.1 hypothetical protein TSTA_059050 [Talaromyces stipitatus ATCC 10500]